MMEMLKLRNGSSESKAMVERVMSQVRYILSSVSSGYALCALVSFCRGKGEAPSVRQQKLLDGFDLIKMKPEGGFDVSSTVRNVLLSIADGEGSDLKFLSSPLAETVEA